MERELSYSLIAKKVPKFGLLIQVDFELTSSYLIFYSWSHFEENLFG